MAKEWWEGEDWDEKSKYFDEKGMIREQPLDTTFTPPSEPTRYVGRWGVESEEPVREEIPLYTNDELYTAYPEYAPKKVEEKQEGLPKGEKPTTDSMRYIQYKYDRLKDYDSIFGNPEETRDKLLEENKWSLERKIPGLEMTVGEKIKEDYKLARKQKDSAEKELDKIYQTAELKTRSEEQLRRLALGGNEEAKIILNQMEQSKKDIAKAGREVFRRLPVAGAPGVYFDRLEGKYIDSTTEKSISSDELTRRELEFKENTTTNDIKVMQQSVPSVLQLVNQARTDMEKALESLGPMAGRWSDLWSGKIGAENPEFRALKTDIGLLQTRLMKMHVGARGGVEMMKHFENYFNAGKDAPENLKSAFDVVERYANEVAQPRFSKREAASQINITPPRTKAENIPVLKQYIAQYGSQFRPAELFQLLIRAGYSRDEIMKAGER